MQSWHWPLHLMVLLQFRSLQTTYWRDTKPMCVISYIQCRNSPTAQTGVSTIYRSKYPGNGSVAIRRDGRVCAVGGWDGKCVHYPVFICPGLITCFFLASDSMERRLSRRLVLSPTIRGDAMHWHSQINLPKGTSLRTTTICLPRKRPADVFGLPVGGKIVESVSGHSRHFLSRYYRDDMVQCIRHRLQVVIMASCIRLPW